MHDYHPSGPVPPPYSNATFRRSQYSWQTPAPSQTPDEIARRNNAAGYNNSTSVYLASPSLPTLVPRPVHVPASVTRPHNDVSESLFSRELVFDQVSPYHQLHTPSPHHTHQYAVPQSQHLHTPSPRQIHQPPSQQTAQQREHIVALRDFATKPLLSPLLGSRFQDAINNLKGTASGEQQSPVKAPKFDLLAYQTSQAALEAKAAADGAAQNQPSTLVQNVSKDNDATTPRKRGRPRISDREAQPRKRRKKGTGPKGGWSKGMKLGPRPAIDPGYEWNSLYSQATNAFIDEDNTDSALELVKAAITINPEIYAAHALLSEILLLRGEDELAVQALFLGAHAAPQEPDVWFQAAEVCLTRVKGSPRIWALQQAVYCFSQIIHTPSARDHHMEARFKRATCSKELCNYSKAMKDFEHILDEDAYNSNVMRQMAEVCIITEELDRAKDLYEDALEYYRENGFEEEEGFTWADVLVYVQILALEVPPEKGIANALKVLKQLARWLLGRDEEVYWDQYTSDDREFDSEDEPRRVLVAPFAYTIHPPEAYGIGIPIEIRVRLGLLRLKQGQQTLAEALAHFEWLEPEARDDGACVYEYPDIFFEVAEALFEAQEHDEALRYYQALLDADMFSTVEFWLRAGECSRICESIPQAIKCFEEAKAADRNCVEARSRLSRLYADEDDKIKAIINAREATAAAKRLLPKTDKRRYEPKEIRVVRREAERALRAAYQLEGPVPDLGIPLDRLEAKFARKGLRGPYKKRKTKDVGEQGAVNAEAESDDEDDSGSDAEESEERSNPHSYALGEQEMMETRREAHRAEFIPPLYHLLVEHAEAMRKDNRKATQVWMDCADVLIQDFKDNRAFFPGSSNPQPSAEVASDPVHSTSREDWEAQQASEETRQDFDADFAVPSVEAPPPQGFREISNPEWLDMILEYALLLAKHAGTKITRNSYDMLDTALDCTLWHQDPQALLLIHITYLACALTLRDEKILYDVPLRWFLRNYHLNDDAFRLFAAMNLVFPHASHEDGKEGQMRNAAFRSKALNKLLQKLIREMDASLPDDYNPNGFGPLPDLMRKGKGGFVDDEHMSTGASPSSLNTPIPPCDQSVKPRPVAEETNTTSIPTPPPSANLPSSTATKITDLSPTLLLLYGQILAAGGTFQSALSYYFRALSLSPNNPVILLSIALAYFHDMPKMPAAGGMRAMWLLQGWAFFERYAEERGEIARKGDGNGKQREHGLDVETHVLVEREIEFNRARVWHMLGMGDLAVKGYERVLAMGGTETSPDGTVDGEQRGGASAFVMEAAYAVSTIYALSGNAVMARNITEKYLVV